MKFRNGICSVLLSLMFVSCAHGPANSASPEEAARLDRKLVKETVVYEPNAKEGAVVPDVSAPGLRAIWVEERIEGQRLIEAHREWLLEGDVTLLGIPKTKQVRK